MTARLRYYHNRPQRVCECGCGLSMKGYPSNRKHHDDCQSPEALGRKQSRLNEAERYQRRKRGEPARRHTRKGQINRDATVVCKACCGLSHRRPRCGGCRTCGKPWEPLPALCIDDFVTNKYSVG